MPYAARCCRRYRRIWIPRRLRAWGERLIVVGTTEGGAARYFSLDLKSDRPAWITLPAWPEASGSVTSAVAQNSMLTITVAQQAAGAERMFEWQPETGWQSRHDLPGRVIEGSARAMGQAHIVYLMAPDAPDRREAQVVSYHTITGSWAVHGALETGAPVYGAGWRQGILWTQADADHAGTKLAYTRLESGNQLLHPVDWAVLAIYLAVMLGVGLYFYRRHARDSASAFFLGGRSIPFWAAGVSLYASNASSISYIAVPAKAFATNWQYLMSNLVVVLGLIFVAVWIVPLLRRLDLMSVFHYLETRFHPAIRTLSSVLFVVFQLGGRMTVILFLPSLAISTVTGIDVTVSVLVMGVVTICYTMLGGMKAVIWTDVLQLVVMFGGTLFAIFSIVTILDGGVAEFMATAMQENKFKVADWSFRLTEATVWGFVFLVIFDTVLTFPKDQVLMQRVFSTKSAKQAGRSIWTFAAIIIPGSVMFYLIGTALYVFYKHNPERMDPSLTVDATFPLFIAAELPVGVTGLIIAGIFAASMSTLSSILNSVATVVTVDIYEKLNLRRKSGTDTSVPFAAWVTVVAGMIGIGLALLLASVEVESILDVALELWGLLGGGFAGAYTLGMFSRRANWQGVAIGVAVSIVVTLFAWSLDMVHPYFYLPLSILVCIVAGYISSLFFPAPESLTGLTVYRQDASVGENIGS